MATVGGVTHRLIWADRNAGWRFRCSCGWIDSNVRWTERSAIYEGNRHIRAARRNTSAGPAPGGELEALLIEAMKDVSTWMAAFVKLRRKKRDVWRQDPEFAARMSELSQTAQTLSLRLKASPDLMEKVTLLSELTELSGALKSAYEEAARMSA
jgi:hypothetical protein